MDSLKVTLSHNFLTEFEASEVDPYRGDHEECTDDGVTDCHANDGVHPVGDGWHLAVAVIEEASDRADKGARMKHQRKHGQGSYGWAPYRVEVEIPDAAVCAIISMLVNDIDKWSGWFQYGDMGAGAYVKVGGNLLAKARDYRDENNLTPDSEYWFN